MNDVVIGDQGEIGQALMKLMPQALGYDIHDEQLFPPRVDETGVRLHIAIPGELATFHHDVRYYQTFYMPVLTIVYSTTPIGTCEKLGAVHSPVVGTHPNLAKSMRYFPRYFGSTNMAALRLASKWWRKLIPQGTVQILDSADHTEMLKLRSTARYGINLAFANYEYQLAEEVGMDGEELVYWDQSYNELYEHLEHEGAKRYLLTDPHGKIGGHCIIPNARILNRQWPSPLLAEILKLA